MAKVVYNGPSHIRELGAEDLKKAEVEGFKHTKFHRGVEVEVADDVAKVLTTNQQLFTKGEFSLVEELKPETPPARTNR